MIKTNYAEMSGPELVTAYNEMLTTPAGRELQEQNSHRYREVQRFADQKTGVARCEALASSIRAVSKAGRENDDAPKTRKAKSAAGSAASKATRSPRAGGNRSIVIDALKAARGRFVSQDDLCTAVYGRAGKDKKGPLNMILKGLVMVDIARRGLPFTLEKKKEGKEISFALIAKD